MIRYADIRVARNEAFCRKFPAEDTNRQYSLAVLWNSDILSFTHNGAMNQLIFQTSALQEWLCLMEAIDVAYQSQMITGAAASAEKNSFSNYYSFLMNKHRSSPPRSSPVFPFSLFNHLLSLICHRTAKNKLIPIRVVEHSQGEQLRVVSPIMVQISKIFTCLQLQSCQVSTQIYAKLHLALRTPSVCSATCCGPAPADFYTGSLLNHVVLLIVYRTCFRYFTRSMLIILQERQDRCG